MASNDILFISKDNGVTERKVGYKTGRLCVSYSNKYNRETFKMYGILSHRPFVQTKFYNFHEAIDVAEYLEEAYHKYLDIWQADPSIDIPLVTRYTIKNGNRIFVALNKLKGRDIISKEDFFLALNGEHNVNHFRTSRVPDIRVSKPKSRKRVGGFVSNFISGFFN